MIIQKIIKSYWLIGLFLYLTISIIGVSSDQYYYFIATALVPFILMGVLVSETAKWRRVLYTDFNLFSITLLCSLLVVFCNHQLSLFIDGDQFVFSKTDAVLYHNTATRLSNLDIGSWFSALSQTRYGIDDWGAFLFHGAVYSLIDSPTFLAIVYCVIGSFTALNIFYIGRCIMTRRYAFLATLSFSISSFILIYHGLFLKETVMIFIIIASFRLFYGYINSRNILYVISAYAVALLIFLFRTPVALIAIMVFTITLILKYTNKVFFPIIIAVGFLLLSTTSAFIYSYDRYLAGGDVERIAERKNNLAMGGGLVNQITDPVAALFGPFPSVVEGTNAVSILNSSGLLFRMLLVLPFLYGVYYIYRNKRLKLYPLAIFFFVNAFGVAMTVKGLEVRLSVCHLFAVYLIAFWGMQHIEFHRLINRVNLVSHNRFLLFGGAVFFMCLLWNLRSFI